MKLTKLPNGNWINLATVTAISPKPKMYVGNDLQPACVVIYHDKQGTEIIAARDFVHAIKLAKEYAELVNAAANGGIPSSPVS